jgi:hypothetical protein|tara:strand:- start:241 stop:432 length:192 start_codon:yes stop_codon:yes gene_type:complete
MKTFNKLMGDIQTVKELVPVVKDKIKEYKPVIKQDATTMKKSFEKEVLPGLKNMANQFKKNMK